MTSISFQRLLSLFRHGLRVVLLFLLFCAFFPTVGAQQPARKRVAVVLSGGGAKGMAHIGVLKVLERAGIPIDIVTGTSMGSIVGGLYCCGWNATALDTLVRHQNWKFLLSDRDDYYSQSLQGRGRQNTYILAKTYTAGKKKLGEMGGLIHGKNLEKLFMHLTAGYTDSISFSRLPIPFACVATDIVTNTEYDFHSGHLYEAMRASMSIPGAFTPIRKGNMVLVDGGLRNNYPADLAREMGADFIIGATVQGPPKTADDIMNGASVLGQIVDVNCKNKYDDNLRITDIPIRVNTQGYSAASFTPAAIDTLIRRGEEEAMRHWDELMTLKRRLGLADDYQPHYLQPDSAAQGPVNFTAAAQSSRPVHDQVTGALGLRFDTEEMVALQLNGIYRSAKVPIDLEATVRLGKRILANAEVRHKLHKHSEAALGYTFRHSDIDLYAQGDDDYSIKLNHHQAYLSVMGINLKNLAMDITARWDYYNYHHLMMNSSMAHDGFTLNDDHYFSYHANLHYDSENNGLFPSRGAWFKAEYAYWTDNFYGYNGHRGFSTVEAAWRKSFRLSRVFTLQPMLYGRLIFGTDIPYIQSNIIGGQWFAHYLEQQLPFVGVGHVEHTDNHFVACQLKLQAQLTDNNFVLLKVVEAQHGAKLRQLGDHHPMLGYQLAYYYRTMLGPVGATLGYSNKTDNVNFYINLGFEF